MKTDEGKHRRPAQALDVMDAPVIAASLTPTIRLRLDEAASAIHGRAAVKAAIYVPTGLMAALILPWPTSVGWIAGGLVLEAWSWVATRAQSRGQTVGWGARANFVANFALSNVWWLLLGLLCWFSNSVAGQACGAALLLALGSVAVLLFRNSALTMLASGMAPATGALTIVVFAGDRSWRELLPICIALGVAAAFMLSVARHTPSAQSQQRLVNESLRKYKLLADNVMDIIGRVDLTGRYQYISPACLKVLGYAPEALVGTRVLDLINPASRRDMVAAFARMLAEPTGSEVVTARTRHRDGSWLWLQTNVKLLLENGVAVGMIGVSRDVTQSVLADIALQEARTEAEAASRAKRDFLANVSHEIRTPMNAVLGVLTLLEAEDLSAEGRELMRQASAGGQLLSQLLDDVLDFSKLESGRLELACEPVDVGEALRSVAALFSGDARAKNIDLHCEVTGADHWIEADPVRLRQTMFNLMSNAVKFTLTGQVAARLDVSALADGGRHVRLEVKDTGIGMTPEAQGHLFERFRQADSATTRRFGGTGLGLSITRALVHLMGGEIGFTSVEGEGSTFWLMFDAPAATALAEEPVGEGILDGLNILLVEDNATNRLVARTMLNRLGATVEEAEDGSIGLAAARRGAHDLILMDIQMPYMDGVEATRAIRGLPGAPSRIPIIALTANVQDHQCAQYRAAGMNAVVAKPISPAALLGAIAQVLAAEETSLTG